MFLPFSSTKSLFTKSVIVFCQLSILIYAELYTSDVLRHSYVQTSKKESKDANKLNARVDRETYLLDTNVHPS